MALQVSHPDNAFEIDASTPFACMIWDTDSGYSVNEMSGVAEAVLHAGCRYVVCGGSKCELWHDIFDEVQVEISLKVDQDQLQDFPLVMTTWHTDDPPAEVTNFLVNYANFDGLVFEDYLLLTTGSQDNLDEIKQALTRSALYLDEED